MTEHPKRLTMLQVDEAKASVSSTTKETTAGEMSEPVDYDEIESRIDVFVGGLLEVPPRYRRAERVIERLVESSIANEVSELEKIAAKLSMDLAFVPYAQLEEKNDEE